MPDIQTALTTALSEWEKDDQKIQQEKQVPKHLFKSTTNVTQETFNYVRDNPRLTSDKIRKALAKKGLNEGSVGSLLTQFTKQGQMAKTDAGEYTTLIPAYAPLKSSKKLRTEGKSVNKLVRKPKSAGIAALNVGTTPKAAPDVETMLNGMSIVQARAMYDALKKIFGG